MAPGASIYLSPKDGAPVLTTFAAGDKADITGLKGGWTQVPPRQDPDRLHPSFPRRLGRVAAAPAAAAAPAVPAASAGPAPAPAAASPSAEPPDPPRLSRLFEGTLVFLQASPVPDRPLRLETQGPGRQPHGLRRPSKLLLTDQIEQLCRPRGRRSGVGAQGPVARPVIEDPRDRIAPARGRLRALPAASFMEVIDGNRIAAGSSPS